MWPGMDRTPMWGVQTWLPVQSLREWSYLRGEWFRYVLLHHKVSLKYQDILVGSFAITNSLLIFRWVLIRYNNYCTIKYPWSTSDVLGRVLCNTKQFATSENRLGMYNCTLKTCMVKFICWIPMKYLRYCRYGPMDHLSRCIKIPQLLQGESPSVKTYNSCCQNQCRNSTFQVHSRWWDGVPCHTICKIL